jgi:4-amino-4-deoxy-L-arabinose transferase-like glycosyltransferase
MSDARLAGLLFAMAILARVVSWMGLAFFGPDSANFLIMADWMAEGRFQDSLSMAYHPLYPLLIAVARPLAGGSVAAGHAISILLGAAATIPLYFIAREVFGRPSAFITALIYALHPRLVDVQSDVMTEATFMFFFLSSMWLTWRMGEEPTLERGVVLALAAVAAFLTRAEGILAVVLAVGWPAVEAVRTRKPGMGQVGAILLTPLVILIVMSPYLLWVKSQRGHWSLSVRPSLLSAERVVGIKIGSFDPAGHAVGESVLYLKYLQSLLRLSLHGALFPFYILGFIELKKSGLRRALYYLAYVGGLLGGVFLTLHQQNAMSDRYIMAGMALLSAAAAAGILSAFRHAARRWPAARWRPAACWAVLLLITVLPAYRWLHVRRAEDRSYADAARWIRSHDRRPAAISGTSQVAYLAGARPVGPPASLEEALKQVTEGRVGCFVYDQRDVAALPSLVGLLHSCAFLEAPVKITGAPGTLSIYVQFVK